MDVTVGQTGLTLKRFRIDAATKRDVPLILRLINGLADYEKLAHEVRVTEEALRESLFGLRPVAEVAVARVASEPVGFALFFHNYSTFLGQRGLYLEDLFVLPEWRGQGAGRALLIYLARLAVERNCGRLEWAVLDWNEPAIRFYQRLGAQAMDSWTINRLTGDALLRLAAESCGPTESAPRPGGARGRHNLRESSKT
jgi:GNAT superfamily N-acetyltransferase